MKSWLVAGVWAVALGVTAPAAAQPQDRLAEARRLFAEGLALGQQGQWEAAAANFRRVMEVRASPPVAYNLAFALEHLGRVVEADDLLGPVLADAATPANVRHDASELAERVRARVARLTVRVGGAEDDAQVSLDGQPVARDALTGRRADPGSHTIALVRGGQTLASREIELAPGSEQTVTLDAPRPEPAVLLPSHVRPAPESLLSAGPPPPRDDGDGRSILTRWWFWTVVGVVVVAGAVSVALVAQPSAPTPLQGSLGLFEVRPSAP